MSNSAGKHIMITGAGGQLAQCIKKHVPQNTPDTYLFVSRKDLDITRADAVMQLFKTFNPDVVINTAAYTQVDKAEEEREKAFYINAEAVQTLAEVCHSYNALLIHISTDYVFDGKADTPYKEIDSTQPQTVYGASKRKGEEFLLTGQLKRVFIVRTSWLYSEFGQNFYKTMLRLSGEKEELQVVNDQLGCPTNANDLAQGILKIIAQTTISDDLETDYGLYHFSNGGTTSWYRFATEIFRLKNINIKVKPVSSKVFPTKAIRPAYSVLSNAKFQETFDFQIPDWDQSLKDLIKQGKAAH